LTFGSSRPSAKAGQIRPLVEVGPTRPLSRLDLQLANLWPALAKVN